MADTEPTSERATALYSKFLDLQMHYGSRNAMFDELRGLFRGEHWGEALVGTESIQLTLNYVQRAVLWHVALLTNKPPRIDVPVSSAQPDPRAARRELFLRTLVRSPGFGRAYRRTELNANKLGVGVFQVVWKPGKGQPISEDLPGAEPPVTQKRYTKCPFVFRAISPDRFFPRYRTHDEPNDFLYVFRYEPSRLVEDIEQQYGIELQATDWASGSRGTCELIEYWDDTDYILLAVTTIRETLQEGRKTEEIERTVPQVVVKKKHHYGRPPFFVLVNVVADSEDDPTEDGSLSETKLVSDLNKHLNLIMSLAATEIATRIHPPATYEAGDTGEHVQSADSIRLGAGEVIPIGAGEKITPLDWRGIPESVSEHRNAIMQGFRDLSGLPRTALGESEGASGIGMRLAYAALELILPLKLPERIDFITEVGEFILEVLDQRIGPDDVVALWSGEGAAVTLARAQIAGQYHCTAAYANILPRDKVEWGQHVAYLQKIGMLSLRTAMEWIEDIDDPDAEIERIRLENADPRLRPDLALAIRQAEQGSSSAQPGGVQSAGLVPKGAGGLNLNAAPPVPAFPATPTQQNVPYLQRGIPPNLGQLLPPGPGVNVGPPIEEQP